MKKFFYALCLAFVFALGAQAQTTTYTYQPSGCSGACSLYYYAPATVTANTPIIFYMAGGSYENPPDMQCWSPNTSNLSLNNCLEITDWTIHGYAVYALRYPVETDTGNPIWPAMGQGAACALSYATTNALPGNWKNITLMGDSAGGGIALVIGMGPVGKYLTDGNSACASSNTTWVVTSIVTNSASTCMDNGSHLSSGGSNCYCSTAGHGICDAVFGGDPTSNSTAEALAWDASAMQYISTWIAKGAPPITQVTSLYDSVVIPGAQALLPAAIAAAGYKSVQVQYNGYQHENDEGSETSAGCNSWPVNFQTAPAACHTTCNNSATGVTECNLWGNVVAPAWSRAMHGRSAGAAGSGSGHDSSY